jgi:hypothetical protein
MGALLGEPVLLLLVLASKPDQVYAEEGSSEHHQAGAGLAEGEVLPHLLIPMHDSQNHI